jgi:hypothetical protein
LPTETRKEKQSAENTLPIKYTIAKIAISNLVPHEGTLDWHLKEIREWIERDGFQARPIAVSSLSSVGPEWKDKYMIHDGHHRTSALQSLGCSLIMSSIFDYDDPRIKVFDYDTESIPISKDVVRHRAVLGVDISPRFDKHFIQLEDGSLSRFHDNSILEPELFTPLSELR